MGGGNLLYELGKVSTFYNVPMNQYTIKQINASEEEICSRTNISTA